MSDNTTFPAQRPDGQADTPQPRAGRALRLLLAVLITTQVVLLGAVGWLVHDQRHDERRFRIVASQLYDSDDLDRQIKNVASDLEDVQNQSEATSRQLDELRQDVTEMIDNIVDYLGGALSP